MTAGSRPVAARSVEAGLILSLALAGCGGSAGHGTGSAPTSATTAASTTTSSPTGPTSTEPAGAPATSSAMCGYLPAAQAAYRHVIWIWMENHTYSSVIGSPSAQYENQLAGECGLATNYHNITHPSLPNYIAATSGLPLSSLGPFSSDCDPSASCSAGPSVQSIFSQVPTWKAYEESMPSRCDRAGSGEYAVRHNPPPYYQGLSGVCASGDAPFGELASDLYAARLPAFSFVTPNLIDDSHDGSVADGDRWLRATVGQIVASSPYRLGTVALFITWDEGEGGSASNCASNTTDVGCHVAAIIVTPSTAAGTRSAALFNHYSLLRTAEDLLGVPALGQAATATPMESAFGLGG